MERGRLQRWLVWGTVGIAAAVHAPPVWFLDLALEHNLRVLVDVPWNKHICFLDSDEIREEARAAVRKTAVAISSSLYGKRS